MLTPQRADSTEESREDLLVFLQLCKSGKILTECEFWIQFGFAIELVCKIDLVHFRHPTQFEGDEEIVVCTELSN